MSRKYDVVALGELLIDFTDNGVSPQGNPMFEANPGGAPCNVLSMLSRLGRNTGFIGKVGKDMFGVQLKKAICECGIDAAGLVLDDQVNTTLAFVQTFEDGDRDFSFYRNPGADMMLGVEDINVDMVSDSRIFHYGTLSMTHDKCREATYKAIELAKDAGAILSFDPNLREPLWSSLDEAKKQVEYGMSKCDILKISDNEIVWFTGEEDYDAGVAWIRSHFPNIKLILVSLGKEGSLAFSGANRVFVPAFIQKNTIETTGAGDTFCASVLNYCLENAENGLDAISEDGLTEMLRFANAAASIVTTRKGALRVMPSRSEIEKIL